MNEEQVKRILKADQDAQAAYDAALEQSHTVPIKAAQRVEDLLVRAKEAAEADAAKIIADATGGNDSVDAERTQNQDSRRMDVLAETNHDNAVKFVLQELIGVDKDRE